MQRSKTFEHIGTTVIGQLFSNWCFQPFLKRGVVSPIFKDFGILPGDEHKLIRWFSGIALLNGVSFKNPVGI